MDVHPPLDYGNVTAVTFIRLKMGMLVLI
jgi:hypothetical protein